MHQSSAHHSLLPIPLPSRMLRIHPSAHHSLLSVPLTPTQGGFDNVVSMIQYIAQTYPSPASPTPAAPSSSPAPSIAPPKETPALGCLHPEYEGGRLYFEQPDQYMKWCVGKGPWCVCECFGAPQLISETCFGSTEGAVDESTQICVYLHA